MDLFILKKGKLQPTGFELVDSDAINYLMNYRFTGKDLYKESLKGWHTHSFQTACHHGVAMEWLWMNYSAPVEQHDYRYLGNTFRERERIKRKSAS